MKTLLSALFLALATPAVAATVDPNGAFHTEDGVDLSFADGFMSFAGDFPGNGLTFGGGDLFTGLSTTGFGILDGNVWSGDFAVMDDFGDLFLTGTFGGLRLGDLSLSGIARITGGSAAALFGTTAILSFFAPDLVEGYEGSAGQVSYVDDAILQLEAAIPAPVPVPAALPMLLGGLGVIGAMKLRKRPIRSQHLIA